jgi:hypothetical protein
VSGNPDLHPARSRATIETGDQRIATGALIPVTSSQIAAVGYDPIAHQLVVRFHGSGSRPAAIYSYIGVPAQIAAGLVAAASPGAYFHRHIRQGGYPYRRHEGVAP